MQFASPESRDAHSTTSRGPAPAPSQTPPAAPAHRDGRVQIGLFVVLFVTYAYFHQGGGWNQNIRFDQVRSIVESADFAVHDYWCYEVVENGGGSRSLRRAPEWVEGRTFLNSRDFAIYENRVFPNKPPGTTLMALPAYWLIRNIESWIGADPDRWWSLTLNLYLITVLSVGAVGSLGGVAFYRTSRALFPSVARTHHLVATLFVFLGTLLLPYSTLLFDHVPTAALLLLAFALLFNGPHHEVSTSALNLRLLLAGLLCGGAVITNYAAIGAVGCMTIYVVARVRPRSRFGAFLLGGVPLGVFLAVYHASCFGSVFATSYTYQNKDFVEGGGHLFGVFGLPDPVAALSLIFSPRSGLLLTSPVLALSLVGFVLMWRWKQRRVELVLLLALFCYYWLMNAAFNKPHGGSAYGPRYLVPVIPFVALPLALVFHRLPRIATVVGIVSVALVLYVTSINVQLPWHLLDLATQTVAAATSTPPATSDDGLPVTSVFDVGVSTNRVGAYELRPLVAFPPGSHQVNWNAFNLGETIAPQSFASVLPLSAFLVVSSAILVRRQRTRDQTMAP